MELGQVLAVLVPLTPVIYWTVSVVKHLTSQAWNALITQVVTLLAAWGIVSLFAQATHLTLNNAKNPLLNLNEAELFLVAWIIAATGGALNDFLRTRNNADSSTLPRLTKLR